MSHPTITCVIPTLNAEAYLAEAIQSVLRQTVPPNEVLVIDDDSADGTREIAQSFGPAVRYVINPQRGPSAARNHGVSISTGQMVSFLDADDLWHSVKLERQLACFESNPALMICLTHVELKWDAALETERLLFADHPRGRVVPGFATITLLAKRQVFDLLGPLNPNLHMADAADWLVRARDAAVATHVLPEALVSHRLHRSNLTRRKREQSANEFLQLVKDSLERRRNARGEHHPRVF